MPINKLRCCSIQFIDDARRGQTTKLCTKQQFADTISCCRKSTAKQRQRKPGHKGIDIEHFGQVSLPINFYVSVPTEGNAQSLSRADNPQAMNLTGRGNSIAILLQFLHCQNLTLLRAMTCCSKMVCPKVQPGCFSHGENQSLIDIKTLPTSRFKCGHARQKTWNISYRGEEDLGIISVLHSC
jgi:hypothetical protein